MTTTSRDGFSSSLGVLAATLGSAVGLGNIWKFPYMVGDNGGAGFLLIYLLATLLVGLPVMISEIALGRSARADAITSFRKLAPNTLWWLIGGMGVLAAFLILAFYSEVAGWVFAYIFKSAGGSILSEDPEVTKQAFHALVTSPQQALLWQWAVFIFIGAIIMLGVSKGIEAVTKRLMPILFILLVLIAIRSLTLPGAMEGVKFLFMPDWSKIDANTVLAAVGLAFFKLSIGMGTMLTYGSYFRSEQNIPLTATRVMLADLTVSLLAGLCIFPAVFALGFEPDSGPSLLFIILPSVFAEMPMGEVFLVVFFVLAAIAATGAMLSILEVPVAAAVEGLKWSRRKATIIVIALLTIVGGSAALSSSTLSHVQVAGMNLFDLYDYISSNILLPLGGILLCIFVSYCFGKQRFAQELSNHGMLRNQWLVNLLLVFLRYVTPLLIIAVMAKGLGLL